MSATDRPGVTGHLDDYEDRRTSARKAADELLDALLAASDDLHDAYRAKDQRLIEAAGAAFGVLYDEASDAIVRRGGV